MYPPPAPAAAPSPAAPSIPPIVAGIGTAAWRLIVAACAFWGVYLVAYQPFIGWTDLWFLSQLGSLVAAIGYALMVPIPLLPVAEKIEPVAAWVRGSLASMMILISIASIFILGGGDLDQTGFLFEHLLTPLVIAADFVLLGRFSAKSKAWHPVTWLGMPLLYLILVNLAGEAQSVYGGILAPSSPEFAIYVGIFLVTAVVFGYALFGLAKLRGLVATGITGQQPAAAGQWQPRQPRQPGPYGPPQAAPAYGQIPQQQQQLAARPPAGGHGAPAYQRPSATAAYQQPYGQAPGGPPAPPRP